MDLTSDHIKEGMEEVFNLSEKGFLDWLVQTENSDMPEWFLRTCFCMDDRKIIEPLIEKFWEEYSDDMEYSHNARG